MLKLIKKFIFTFNVIAILLLLGAYASTFVSADKIWFLAFLGLAYPALIILNLFFVFVWLIQFNYRCLYSLITIVIGWQHLVQTFKITNTVKQEKGIKIATYNAGLFGYFQNEWQTESLKNYIKNNKPDILCVQEFLNLGATNSTLDSLKKEGNFKYTYFEKLNDGRKKGEYGLAIFSNYKIESSGLVHFDQITGNMCTYADIEIEKDLIRFYNVHLQSFRFKKKDYEFIKDIPEDNNQKIEHSKNIISRMKNAYIKRAEQVDIIKKDINQLNYNYCVIGDFNDPPVSYAYASLSRKLKDAFVENGIGFSKTYIGLMPNFRIDYILYPKSFMGLNYKTYTLSSDHQLVETIVKIN